MIGSVATWAASDTPRLSLIATRQPAPRDAVDPFGQWRPPRDQPGGREGRQLEPRIADQRRVGEEQQGRRPAEGRRGPSRAAALAGEQHDARHERRAHDRRRPTGEGDVDDDGHDRHDRPAAAPEATRSCPDRRRDDRDVPAGDGDDVADAGRRERRGQVAVDEVAESDQDARGQPRLGFGEDHCQTLGGAAADAPRGGGRGRRWLARDRACARSTSRPHRFARGTCRTAIPGAPGSRH